MAKMHVKVGDRFQPETSVAAADRLIEVKKKNQNNVWAVFDEVIKVWEDLRPEEYKSSIVDMDFTKGTLTDKEFGTAGDTKGTGVLRRTLDIPAFIELVLRKVYTTEELPFDKNYYVELWKRYPQFRVSDKI